LYCTLPPVRIADKIFDPITRHFSPAEAWARGTGGGRHSRISKGTQLPATLKKEVARVRSWLPSALAVASGLYLHRSERVLGQHLTLASTATGTFSLHNHSLLKDSNCPK
jgi:hypothetical protein